QLRQDLLELDAVPQVELHQRVPAPGLEMLLQRPAQARVPVLPRSDELLQSAAQYAWRGGGKTWNQDQDACQKARRPASDLRHDCLPRRVDPPTRMKNR